MFGCCCPDKEQINWWSKGWMIANSIGLFLTWSSLWFRVQCQHYEDEPITWKLWHILVIPLGFLWIAGIIFGVVVWIKNFCELSEGDIEIKEKCTLRNIGNFLNSSLSVKIKK
jgi:hypothetical protein